MICLKKVGCRVKTLQVVIGREAASPAFTSVRCQLSRAAPGGLTGDLALDVPARADGDGVVLLEEARGLARGKEA